jgi:hypothetical protein
MSTSSEMQLVTSVARDLVSQISPQELPLFRAVSIAYAKDPVALEKPGNVGQMLGFGSLQLGKLIAPAVLATTHAVVAYLEKQIGVMCPQDNETSRDDLLTKTFRSVPNVQQASMAGQDVTLARRVRWREMLVEAFSDSDLRTLCFDMGLDYEVIGGDGKAGKARELLMYCERCGCTESLITAAARARPNLPWQDDSRPVRASDGGIVLTNQQLARVREVALLKAKQLNLGDNLAVVLADSLAGSLVLT